jgi:4-nitrophenyl phosphatase
MDLAAAMARLRSGPMRAEPTRVGGIISSRPNALKGFPLSSTVSPMSDHGDPPSTARPPRRLVILDMDGVLYRGDRAIPGAANLVGLLHEAGVAVRYATNNSMFTRDQYAERLAAMDIPAAANEIVTSTSATIEHLRRHQPDVRAVLAVGAAGMVTELDAAGYSVVPIAAAASAAADAQPFDAVLVGLDPDFDEGRLAVAAAAVRAGARFVATNADARYPTPSGFRPGAGAMVAAIAEASGVAPLVIGKPEPAMFAAILEAAGVEPAAALVIGDNPDSDIAGAHRSGIRSVLVLTGVTDADQAVGLTGDRRPDHVVADPAAAWDLLEGWLAP